MGVGFHLILFYEFDVKFVFKKSSGGSVSFSNIYSLTCTDMLAFSLILLTMQFVFLIHVIRQRISFVRLAIEKIDELYSARTVAWSSYAVAESTVAVSYTHLDVYKRQVQSIHNYIISY